MPKRGCGMISFGDSLGVFGGYGIPRGPTEPQSFINDTGSTDGRGWTNEFHIYHLKEGAFILTLLPLHKEETVFGLCLPLFYLLPLWLGYNSSVLLSITQM